MLLLAAPAQAAEKRCGILSNPTPANWWLTDRDGEWTIGAQGGYQAEGIENILESFFEDGWVRTNGYYGYRCGCLSVESDRRSMRILRVHSASPLPMRRCDADKALQRQINRER
ncbi:MAG: DUF4087 domain-containing protein [Novosphingobium sp.]|nr:DUF4087 domain-containing protein [Novosphingobium sp.]